MSRRTIRVCRNCAPAVSARRLRTLTVLPFSSQLYQTTTRQDNQKLSYGDFFYLRAYVNSLLCKASAWYNGSDQGWAETARTCSKVTICLLLLPWLLEVVTGQRKLLYEKKTNKKTNKPSVRQLTRGWARVPSEPRGLDTYLPLRQSAGLNWGFSVKVMPVRRLAV